METPDLMLADNMCRVSITVSIQLLYFESRAYL